MLCDNSKRMQMDYSNVQKHFAKRTHKAMIPVLMHPDAEGPETHYYMIRGGKEQRNVTIWEPGTVGNEYIKTFGHYHVGSLDETYWVVHGEGVLLMQKLKDANDPSVVDTFQAITVRAGDEHYIPAGHGHLVANTGHAYLVTIDNSPVDFTDREPASLPGHADYAPVEHMRGFAFYVIEHNSKPALTKNPRYKQVMNVDFGGLEVIG